MAVVADSGALYALYDVRDVHHSAVRTVFMNEEGPIVVPVAILAEVDYLLREYLGVDAELDFLKGIEKGAYTLDSFTDDDLWRCQELLDRYRSLELGLADAAVMATAERLGLYRILTVDQRDFRAVVPKGGRAFVLLPFDAQ